MNQENKKINYFISKETNKYNRIRIWNKIFSYLRTDTNRDSRCRACFPNKVKNAGSSGVWSWQAAGKYADSASREGRIRQNYCWAQRSLDTRPIWSHWRQEARRCSFPQTKGTHSIHEHYLWRFQVHIISPILILIQLVIYLPLS